jgi:predicted RNase H-like nuclease (RuvC/YqgF family)
MKIDNFNQNHIIVSQDLERKINLLRSKLDNNQAYFICEQDIVGVKIEKYFNSIIIFFKNILRSIKNNFIIKFYRLLVKRSNQTNKLLNKFEHLEKKLDDQQKFLEKNFELNSKLKNDIDNINNKIDSELENQRPDVSNDISDVIGHNSSNRVDFYQEENLRLGNELVETKKKFEILKNELDKYEDQRSNLISKINSINDEINNSNILTNVFENNVQPKVQITDHNKIPTKEVDDINEQVKAIFSKKI